VRHEERSDTLDVVLKGVGLGLIPMEGEGPLERAQAFADALAGVLGTPVRIHYAAGYRALVTALQQRLVHVAWLPPLPAARAVRDGSIVPIAAASRSGATSYMTALIARKGGRVKTLDDLRGVKVAWVDRESASGYVVIRSALSRLGVSLVDAFSEELFLRSHAEVARAVNTGRVDVGATCFNVTASRGPRYDEPAMSYQIARTGYAGESGLPVEHVEMIAHAGPIPSDIFAAHASLDALQVRSLETMLTEARPAACYELARTLMHADAFAKVGSAHMQLLHQLFDEVVARSETMASRGSIRPKP
jgi:phosphonate transport system substrate-binding protein